MGLFDNLRNFFKRTNNTTIIVQEDDRYKKSVLATQIVNLIGDIIKK